MASKGRALARAAEAAENQSKLVALINAKLNLLLANAGIQFDDEAFLNGESGLIEESTEPSLEDLGRDSLPEGDDEVPPVGDETPANDGVGAESKAATKSKK